MPQRKGLVAPQNTFLDTIATRFDGTHSNFVLGNAQVNEHPIVYCSDGLIELTGYNRSQMMSRCCSCSFLWGERTTEDAKQRIMDALANKKELQIEVYFHKKSGYAFLCLMDIVPIKNDKSQVVLFLVSHKDITTERRNKGPSSSDVFPPNCHEKLTRNHAHKAAQSLRSNFSKPSSFLSAGLATTITAAALGTTSFRKNKLLDYLHANQIEIAPICPPRSIPVRLKTSTPSADDSDENRLHPRTSRRSHARSSMSKTDDIVPLTTESPISSPQSSLTERGSLMPIKDLDICERGEDAESSQTNNVANQALLISDCEDDSDKSTESESSEDPSTTYKFQRRRSRAVLYQLSGRFDQKSKRKTPLKRFQRISGKDAIPEYKVQDVQASRFILLHYSLFKIVWDWMILICTFYIAIMVPYNAAFSLDTDGKDLLICDIIVELLFIIDIILNFVTTFVSKSGQVVYQTRAIAINYLRGWFFLDLVAAIPFDVILAVHNRDVNGTIGGVGSWIQLLKLARLLRLARLFQKIERYSQYSTVILGLLMCMFFLIAHWFACGWFSIGWADYESSKTREYSWLFELSRRMQVSVMWNHTESWSRRALYVSSLYFTTTSLTSVGFGNVSPNTVNEKIFSIIAMLIGALMHAAVFGNVTTLIQRMYARRSAYQTKNQDLKDFTRAHHIPKPLKQRMLEFFQAMWAINRGIDKEAIMQSFPENVRGDIALHLNREMLALPIFKTASPGCRKCLAQMITTRFATPGEYLVNRGDLLRYIFLVCSGSLEILGPEGTVVGLLGKCDIFGSDIDERPSIGFSAYDVKSLTYCELQCLALDAKFLELVNQYPTFKKQFAAALHEELSFNIRDGFDPSSASEVLPAITLLPEDVDNSSVDRIEDDKVEAESDKDEEQSGKPVRLLHSCLVQNNGSVTYPLNQTRDHNFQVSSTAASYEISNKLGTNTIALEPELCKRLDFIDNQQQSENLLPPVLTQTCGCLKDSSTNTQSTSYPFDWVSTNLQYAFPSRSCPNLSQENQLNTTDYGISSYTYTIGNEQWNKDMFNRSHPFSHTLYPDKTNMQHMHRSTEPTDLSGSFYQFLNHIHQELRTMRTEIQWITRHISTLHNEMNQLKADNSVLAESRRVRHSPPPPLSLSSRDFQWKTRANKNHHDNLGAAKDSSVGWTLSEEPVTSDTSPTERYQPGSSILFNSSHLDSPKQTSDHKVVKFQLPPRRALSKQHSSSFGSRSRISASQRLRDRGGIRSIDSDSSLPRVNSAIKRAGSPARLQPN